MTDVQGGALDGLPMLPSADWYHSTQSPEGSRRPSTEPASTVSDGEISAEFLSPTRGGSRMSQMSQGGFHSAQSVVRPWGSSTLSASIPGTPAMPIHGNGAQMHDAHANTTLADLALSLIHISEPTRPY